VSGWATDVSFAVRTGEILGFAELVGSGRTEPFEGLFGLRARGGGTIELAGRRVDIASPRDAAAAGLTYLSEDRKGKGLLLNFGPTPESHAHALSPPFRLCRAHGRWYLGAQQGRRTPDRTAALTLR